MTKAQIIGLAEKIFLALLVAPFIVNFIRVAPTHPYFLLLMVSEVLAVGFILIRKPGEMAASPYAILVAFAGTALPLLARPGGGVSLVPDAMSSALMIAGLLIQISAKLALNRSYGLIAANRGVKMGGPYRLVRHPMYLGYIVTQIGFLFANFSLGLLVLYAAAWAAQALRIAEEEKTLSEDPVYQTLKERVRWRLAPGVF